MLQKEFYRVHMSAFEISFILKIDVLMRGFYEGKTRGKVSLFEAGVDNGTGIQTGLIFEPILGPELTFENRDFVTVPTSDSRW